MQRSKITPFETHSRPKPPAIYSHTDDGQGKLREARYDPETVNVNNAQIYGERTMINFIKNFRKDEDGAVTVDWVVLTAAVVGLAVAAYSTIETNSQALIDAAAARVALENDF